MTPPRKWNKADLAELQVLRSQGKISREIAEIMGRTEKSIRGKLEWIKLTPEMRKKRYDAEARRRMRGVRVRQPDGRLPRAPIPAVVLEDRDRRYSIPPRDLTAALLGDPIPGMSALERRENG